VALEGEGLPETVATALLGLYPAKAKIVATATMKSPAARARPVGRCHPDQPGQLGPTFIPRCNGTQPESFRALFWPQSGMTGRATIAHAPHM
jgi:hypothetical protein